MIEPFPEIGGSQRELALTPYFLHRKNQATHARCYEMT
jgi:hypothetical protein